MHHLLYPSSLFGSCSEGQADACPTRAVPGRTFGFIFLLVAALAWGATPARAELVLATNPTMFSTSCDVGATVPDQTLELWNTDPSGTLNYYISDNADWLSVTPESGSSSGEHDFLTVNYEVDGLGAGIHRAEITITAPSVSRTLPVVLVVGLNKLLATDGGEDDQFGGSFDIDGNRVAIGAKGYYLGTGAVYIYENQSGAWALQTILEASDGSPCDNFGESVALDGDTLVVGANNDDGSGDYHSGSVYIFTKVGTSWTQEAKVIPDDDSDSAEFGYSVDVEGDRVVIGAPYEAGLKSSEGAAYVFTRTNGNWIRTAKLKASDPAMADYFGLSVAISGNTVVIGAPSRYSYVTGSAYIFSDGQQGWQLNAELIGNDSEGGDLFGKAVTIDANTIAVGAPGNGRSPYYSGAVYVFDNSSGNWAQQSKLIDQNAATYTQLGKSVSISGDTILAGTGEYGPGSVFVFAYERGQWIIKTKFSSIDGADGDQFGFHVALDSGIAVCGAPLNDDLGNQSGSTYIYNLEYVSPSISIQNPTAQSIWTTSSNPLTTLEGTASDFGGSGLGKITWTNNRGGSGVAAGTVNWSVPEINLNPGENLITVTAIDRVGNKSSDSLTIVYTPPVLATNPTMFSTSCDVGATVPDQTLALWNGGTSDSLNYSVTVDADWLSVTPSSGSVSDIPTTLSISHDTAGLEAGVYEATITIDSPDATNTPLTRPVVLTVGLDKLLSSDRYSDDSFGNSIAIDGDTMVIGDYAKHQYRGAAYVFVRSGDLWLQHAKLTGDSHSSHFGESVAIDGDTIVVGAPEDSTTGASYVFLRSGSTWTLEAKLFANDANDYDEFGDSVAILGDTVIVGAVGDDEKGQNAGSAYIFYRINGAWRQQVKLFAEEPETGDQFGDSVAIDQDTLVVGARRDRIAGVATGSASVFVRSGVTWTQQAKLNASDGAEFDDFGGSVAIAGDYIVVGASKQDSEWFLNGPLVENSGAAYIFMRHGSAWTQQVKLIPRDEGPATFFGDSVAIKDRTVLVGAPGAINERIPSGAVYLFRNQGGIWTRQVRLAPPTIPEHQGFGASVAISREVIAIGAPWENRTGAVYFIDHEFDPPVISIEAPTNGPTWTVTTDTLSLAGIASDEGGSGLTSISWTNDRGGNGETTPTMNWTIPAIPLRAGENLITVHAIDRLANRSSDTLSVTFDIPSIAATPDSLSISCDQGDIIPDQTLEIWNSGTGTLNYAVSADAEWLTIMEDSGSSTGEHDEHTIRYDITGLTPGVYQATISIDALEAYPSQISIPVVLTVGLNKLLAGDGKAYSLMGNSVAIEGDTAVIGATYEDLGSLQDVGAAYVFKRLNGVWIQQCKLWADEPAERDGFGTSVAISGDTIIVGSSRDDDEGTNSGAAYIFGYESGGWSLTAKLKADDARDHAYFGQSVSIDGDTIVIGDSNLFLQSVYVFSHVNGVWSQDVKLLSPDTERTFIPGSLDIKDEQIIIGSENRTLDEYAALIFIRDNGQWISEAVLVPNDGAPKQGLGNSVAIDGDTAIVGTPFDRDRTGAAYVFNRTGQNWAQQAKLTGDGIKAGDKFGSSVAINDNTILIGCPSYDDEGTTNTGSAFVFTRSGNVWNQKAKLFSSDRNEHEYFGNSVALSNDTALIGAAGEDELTTNSGAAYAIPLSEVVSHSISGVILDERNAGISGVRMSGLHGQILTDADGHYSATVAYGWAGTIDPQKTGYRFDPPFIEWTNVTMDLSDQNFTGYAGSYPSISLQPLDPHAAEAGAEPAAIRIRRSDFFEEALAVGFAISGTAIDADYTLSSPSPITIPAGAEYVDLILTPVDDAHFEGPEPESATLRILPADTYDLGIPLTATVAIDDNDTGDLDAALAEHILQYLLGMISHQDRFDCNGDGTIDVSDVLIARRRVGPETPASPTPANWSRNVATDATLDWADCHRADAYDLYVWQSDEPKPAEPTHPGLIRSRYAPAADWAFGTTYYWQVVAVNQLSGKTAAGPTWEFTTKDDEVLVHTPNGGETWTVGQQAQIHWELGKESETPLVRLELWRGGQMVHDFGLDYDESGEHKKTIIVPPVPAGSDYKIRTTSLWLEKYRPEMIPWDESDAVFSIVEAE